MKEVVYNLIPNDRYITRKELQELTGLRDRVIRNHIHDIRLEHTIISLSSGKGYKRAKSTKEMTQEEIEKELVVMKRAINENNSRIKNIKKVMRSQIAYLKILEKGKGEL